MQGIITCLVKDLPSNSGITAQHALEEDRGPITKTMHTVAIPKANWNCVVLNGTITVQDKAHAEGARISHRIP